jgi:hypothetical protein
MARTFRRAGLRVARAPAAGHRDRLHLHVSLRVARQIVERALQSTDR